MGDVTTLITGLPGLVASALVERLPQRRPDERFVDFVGRHLEIDSGQEHR